MLFIFVGLREKVLENNKNWGKTQEKVKYKTAVNAAYAAWYFI